MWFPFSRHEPQPYKKRPVLILAAVGHIPDQAVLVAMVTSNQNRVQNPGPGDVLVNDWKRAGLRQPSVVRTRRLRTAEARDFEGTLLGTVEPTVLEEVRQHVRSLLGV